MKRDDYGLSGMRNFILILGVVVVALITLVIVATSKTIEKDKASCESIGGTWISSGYVNCIK